MSLSEEFKAAVAARGPSCGPQRLTFSRNPVGGSTEVTTFDFLTRCMTVTVIKEHMTKASYDHDGYAAMAASASVTPFSQLVRDMLENMREYLISTGNSAQPLAPKDDGQSFNPFAPK